MPPKKSDRRDDEHVRDARIAHIEDLTTSLTQKIRDACKGIMCAAPAPQAKLNGSGRVSRRS